MRILEKEEFVEKIMKNTKNSLSNEVKKIIEEKSRCVQRFYETSIDGIGQEDTTVRIVRSLRLKK